MGLEEFQRQNIAAAAKKNIFTYEKYKRRLQEDVSGERQKDAHERKYSKDLIFREDLRSVAGSGTVRISPELTKVWPEIKKEKHSEQARKLAEKLLEKECVTVDTGKMDGNYKKIWFGTTANGIDIRPGLVAGEDAPRAVRLGDDCVHALMAGRTGSGKSNALHVLITSLMYEYAPWELNINLADFKIVELSKYGNHTYELDGVKHSAAAPHVEKIAATDSMEYVLSVMYDMYEKMDIRQKAFAALGFQKLSQYRNEYHVVLPREILIVDEFQQMYELATPSQREKINRLIKMITKLGRATGYHLLFASQSMSGTVPSDVVSNFKLRLCLPADADVSMMVLGNKAAGELTGNESKGYLIANAEGGAESYNIKYKVPLISENEKEGSGDLVEALKENAILAEKVGYKKSLDFYREEHVRPLRREAAEEIESSFEKDLNQFYKNTRTAVAGKADVEDYLLLGDSCVYTRSADKNSALEYIPLQIADRKNILCLGDSIYQRAYMMELLAMQYAKRGENNINYVVHGDAMVRSLFESMEQLKDSQQSDFLKFPVGKELMADKLTECVHQNYQLRNTVRRFSQLPKAERTLENENKVMRDMYEKGLREDGEFSFKKLKTVTFWVNGYHMLGDLMQEWEKRKSGQISMEEILKKCTNMGMRFILIGTKAADLPSALAKSFEYRFVMSNDESNYTKSGMQYPKEYKEELLRFKAANEALNRQKPGLYILPQDEKLVKMFDADMGNQEGEDREFFKGI